MFRRWAVNIVLVAEEAAGVHALKLVVESPHRLSAVLTDAGGSEGARGVTVAGVAKGLGVRALPAQLVKDPAFADELRRERVDVLLNVHSLYVINAQVVAAPRVGGFNLHPGPLPAYAGLNVPSWAIYNEEQIHGATLHWLAPGIDTGPIAYSAFFPLTERDTGLSVSAKCVEQGIPLIRQLLDDLASASGRNIPRVGQDLCSRQYYGRKVPHDGWIQWGSPARRVAAFVRACDYGLWPSPWGRPRTLLSRDGEPLAELELGHAVRTGIVSGDVPGTVGRVEGGELWIATGDEWVTVKRLRLDRASVTPGEILRPGDVLLAGNHEETNPRTGGQNGVSVERTP